MTLLILWWLIVRSDKIILSDKQPFAQGGAKDVYAHPRDPALCLKVVRADFKPTASADERDENRREFAAAQYIATLPNRAIQARFPRYYGFVATDIGRALVSDLIRDYDGDIARPVDYIIFRDGYTDAIQTALADFLRCFVLKDFPFTDLGLPNLILQSVSPREQVICLCECNLWPRWPWYTRWYKPLRATRRKQKRINKLHYDIDQLLYHKKMFLAARGESS